MNRQNLARRRKIDTSGECYLFLAREPRRPEMRFRPKMGHTMRVLYPFRPRGNRLNYQVSPPIVGVSIEEFAS